MRVVAERGVYIVDEIGKGQFVITLTECTCEDQTVPELIACSTGKCHGHGCYHVTGGSITLPELTLRLGAHFTWQLGDDGVRRQMNDDCCRTNRIVEILP